ncbi:uncharacterized protein LOC105694584 [Orussus abietinus]|uniref:uncharacterized protein LOC105694584 n=1 Tax=Orussus abietinus TaxID=222816 RepID=UPI0006254730|nr:uncharacterized protein LOC105694584 [Orussus abietinus]
MDWKYPEEVNKFWVCLVLTKGRNRRSRKIMLHGNRNYPFNCAYTCALSHPKLSRDHGDPNICPPPSSPKYKSSRCFVVGLRVTQRLEEHNAKRTHLKHHDFSEKTRRVICSGADSIDSDVKCAANAVSGSRWCHHDISYPSETTIRTEWISLSKTDHHTSTIY